MATSILKLPISGSTYGTSSISFSDIAPEYMGSALDRVDSNIATYTSGVHEVSSSGGPYFTVVLGKYSDTYYSGLCFYYSSNVIYLFRRFGTLYSLHRIS